MIELNEIEIEFILNLFKQTQVNVTDPNATRVCELVQTITAKLNSDEDLR